MGRIRERPNDRWEVVGQRIWKRIVELPNHENTSFFDKIAHFGSILCRRCSVLFFSSLNSAVLSSTRSSNWFWYFSIISTMWSCNEQWKVTSSIGNKKEYNCDSPWYSSCRFRRTLASVCVWSHVWSPVVARGIQTNTICKLIVTMCFRHTSVSMNVTLSRLWCDRHGWVR